MKAITLILFTTLLFSGSSCFTKNDYCSHKACPLDNQHTICVTENVQSPRLLLSGMTPWMKQQIMYLHNRHRDNVASGLDTGQPAASNMRKMYWDDELEVMARGWSQQCQSRHDECRNSIRFNVFQNIDVRPLTAKVTQAQLLSDVVGSWFSGSREMDPGLVRRFEATNCSRSDGCNANWYSAAAWAGSWRIGCSQALCVLSEKPCDFFQDVSSDPEKNLEESSNSSSTFKPILKESTKEFLHLTLKNTRRSPLHRGLNTANDENNISDEFIIAYTVCNYGPAGNVPGLPIYDIGVACSNCPPKTSCNDPIHRSLCAINKDPSQAAYGRN